MSPLLPSAPAAGYMVADIRDASPKSVIASMEYPFFSLRAGDKRVRRYERAGITVEVRPGQSGCATQADKDVWHYCIGQLLEAMNRGREDVSRTVRFTAYDFLVATNRGTSGRGYERMGDALRRLSETRIETNIETDGRRERAGWGLIDAWRIIERGGNGRMVAVEVTLPDWVWRSVLARQVLTLSRDYFQLRSLLARRIYEIARKHCGNQPTWRVSLTKLREKSGSTTTSREFRRLITETCVLPDYRMVIDDGGDVVTFRKRPVRAAKV